MKCDELKVYHCNEWHNEYTEFYMKSDVDAVIAEKDRALEFAKALTLKDIEIIKEKDKEIAELKAQLESEKASRYAESVDAGMRERRLKRALWLARTISAINAVGEIHNVIVCMRERNPKMSLSNTEAQEQVWKDVARKCRAKAEEYK